MNPDDVEALARGIYDAQGDALVAMFGADDLSERPSFDLLDPPQRSMRLETAAAFLARGWKVVPPQD